jgi:hypothetical protein
MVFRVCLQNFLFRVMCVLSQRHSDVFPLLSNILIDDVSKSAVATSSYLRPSTLLSRTHCTSFTALRPSEQYLQPTVVNPRRNPVQVIYSTIAA